MNSIDKRFANAYSKIHKYDRKPLSSLTEAFNAFLNGKVELNESNLNRVREWVKSKDVAFLTAWRTKLDNATDNTCKFRHQPKPEKGQAWRLAKDSELPEFTQGEEFSTHEKKVYNRELKAKLLSMGYGVTNTRGVYREEGISSSQGDTDQEESFMVVNLNDDADFYENIFKLSEYYNQDSFLYKPKEEEKAYLVGTNNSEFPGYGNKVPQGSIISGVVSQFMSRIGNKGFSFAEKDDTQTDNPLTFAQRKANRMPNINGVMECFDDYSVNSKYIIEQIVKDININFEIKEKKMNLFEEAYRKVKNAQTNFLNECYSESTFNNAPMVQINETNAKRMLDRHTANGYIVISPCRGGDDFNMDSSSPDYKEKLAQINNKRIKEMIADIKASGYAYTPTYGGFIENLGTPEEENVYERSFIIYNQLKNRGVGNFETLYNFGIALSKKYNQDSFLCQAPGEKPKYITQNGDVDMEFSGNVTFNDMAQEYFTDLHKNTHKFDDADKRKPTRFSFVECYVNPSPQCYSERVIRGTNGEIFI